MEEDAGPCALLTATNQIGFASRSEQALGAGGAERAPLRPGNDLQPLCEAFLADATWLDCADLKKFGPSRPLYLTLYGTRIYVFTTEMASSASTLVKVEKTLKELGPLQISCPQSTIGTRASF